MKLFRKIQKFVSILLLITTLMLMYNNNANMHRHLSANGQTYVHAHPFSKNQDNAPIKKHQHTSNEIYCISLLNNLFAQIILLGLFILSFFLHSKKLPFVFQTVKYSNGRKYFTQLRAPPAIY